MQIDKAYGLTARRGIHNARGANRDVPIRKNRGRPVEWQGAAPQ